MNEHGMLHIADSAYCFPVSEKELVLRLRTAKGDIKKASVIYESKYVFGEKQKTQDMEKAYYDRIYDYFKNRTFIERIGEYYQEDAEQNPASEEILDVNKSKKRVITYILQN